MGRDIPFISYYVYHESDKAACNTIYKVFPWFVTSKSKKNTSPMMIHKITPSIDYIHFQTKWTNNKNSIRVPKDVKPMNIK